MADWYPLMGGKVHVRKRAGSNIWQCYAHLEGRELRKSTGFENLAQAMAFAEDWYLDLRGKARAGLLPKGKLFRDAADQFLKEYGTITEGERSPAWVKGHGIRLRLHLRPFFDHLPLSEITAGKAQDYRTDRIANPKPTPNQVARGKKDKKPPKATPPSRSTLHDEIVTLRLVLKAAHRHRWLENLPDLSPPYKSQGKIRHRPWFSPEEYKALYTATGDYAKKPHHEHDKWNAEQVHDYVLFLANTGLRPDEARNLQHRDVKIATSAETGNRILEIEVRGKRGIGYCKSRPEAVHPYQRLLKRAKPLPKPKKGEPIVAATKPTYPEQEDPVFPGNHVSLFNGVLRRAKLKLDRDGNRRTAYSLRHTYICMRLMEGADIYQIAKNCRTSVEMIEKFYAAHLKNTLDEAAINVLKKKVAKPKRKTAQTRKKAAIVLAQLSSAA